MESADQFGTISTTTSTPTRSGNRRPSSYFAGICTPMVMKKKPKKTTVQQSPMIDLEYEDISNVPLPPLEEGEISSTSTDHLSVLIVGEGPMTNRTVQEEQSIVIVQEVNGRRRPPAPPRIRDKSPFIRKLRRKSGKKPLPVKIITKYKNRSICHAKRVEERSFNRSLQRYKKERKKARNSRGNSTRTPRRNFPSLHEPQRNVNRRQRLRETAENSQPRHDFNPNAAPVINFIPLGQTVKFGESSSSKETEKRRLRPIIIDGQNVGVEHGKENSIGPVLGSTGLDWRKKFSARGIELCVEYFKKRGHDQVVAWLPRKPKGIHDFKENWDILEKLKREGNHIKETMVKKLSTGEIISSYDDRSIIDDAATCGGIVVSNDQFRDLMHEGKEFREVIDTRVLNFNFRKDTFHPCPDPLGRKGPTLEKFLQF